MRVGIFGLGYVGVVTAAILADQGHHVIGVDINKDKVSMIKEGISPIFEKDVPELVNKVVKRRSLSATTDAADAVLSSEISVICVGTPSEKDGSADLSYVRRVMEEIASILKARKKEHLIVLRSTVPAGTTDNLVMPIFKGIEGVRFCYNPEFLREGSSIADYYSPPYTIVACSDDRAEELMREYYKPIQADFIRVDFPTAETIKVVNNVFHAYKIVFANEIKRYCEAQNIDANAIMNLVVKDTKLNISSMYLKPGFAFGGSCLPKDLRSFRAMAKMKDLKLPAIENVLESNEEHVRSAIREIEAVGKKTIGVIGLSFKEGTDDLRESPHVQVVEYFLGKGYDVKIFDPFVAKSKLIGANREFIEHQIPHISKLLKDDIEEVMRSDIILQNHNIELDRDKEKAYFDLR